MKTNFRVLIFGGMILFILLHLFFSEMGYFAHQVEPVLSILGGFLPSVIVGDSLSTRNPVLESFVAVLSDLPGAYSFYYSPILVSLQISNGSANGQKIPQWINYPDSPINPFFQNGLFLFLLFLLLGCIYLLYSRIRTSRIHTQE